jgi:hypothetical protein
MRDILESYIMHALKIYVYAVYFTILQFNSSAVIRTTAHDIAPRNCTDSEHDPDDDKNDICDWH